MRSGKNHVNMASKSKKKNDGTTTDSNQMEI